MRHRWWHFFWTDILDPKSQRYANATKYGPLLEGYGLVECRKCKWIKVTRMK